MIKSFIAAAAIATAPIAANAFTLNADQEQFCEGLGKLSAVVAIQKNQGMSETDAFSDLVAKGLNEKIAFMVVTIVYERIPNASPESVGGMTYLTCRESVKDLANQ